LANKRLASFLISFQEFFFSFGVKYDQGMFLRGFKIHTFIPHYNFRQHIGIVTVRLRSIYTMKRVQPIRWRLSADSAPGRERAPVVSYGCVQLISTGLMLLCCHSHIGQTLGVCPQELY